MNWFLNMKWINMKYIANKKAALKNITLLFLGLVLFSCSENTNLNNTNGNIIKSMCTNINESLLECDFKDAVCEGSVRHFTDEVGDNKPFVDLTEMTMTVGEDCIGFTISVDSMPEKLTLNQDALKVNDLNYSWGVWLDLNENSYPMDGDLRVTIDKYKWEENSETTINIMSKAVASVTELSLSGGDAIAFISSSLSENTFNIYLPKSLHSKVAKILITTPVQFSATFNDGKSSYRDYYPSDVTTIN